MNKWRAIVQGTALMMTLTAGTMLAQEISTDFDHSANFGQYHTFCFNKVYASTPAVQDKLKDAIAKDLTAKGWQQSDSGCNISVAAVGDVKDQKEYHTFYDSLGPGWDWSAGLSGWGTWGNESSITSVDNIPVGLLVVDLYDTNSKQLVWRGTSRDYLSGNADKNAQKLSKSVDKMLNKFPPKSK